MAEVTEVKVKVVEEFKDCTADLRLRKKNETLTVSEERAKKLEGLGLIKRVVAKETAEKKG